MYRKLRFSYTAVIFSPKFHLKMIAPTAEEALGKLEPLMGHPLTFRPADGMIFERFAAVPCGVIYRKLRFSSESVRYRC